MVDEGKGNQVPAPTSTLRGQLWLRELQMYASKSSKVHLLQQREERRLKTNLETIVENQIVKDFFIDFTMPVSSVVPPGYWRLIW